MGTIANAKVTHYYNCYNGDFIGCLLFSYFHAKVVHRGLHSPGGGVSKKIPFRHLLLSEGRGMLLGY